MLLGLAAAVAWVWNVGVVARCVAQLHRVQRLRAIAAADDGLHRLAARYAAQEKALHHETRWAGVMVILLTWTNLLFWKVHLHGL